MRHNFRGNQESDDLIAAAEQIMGNKSEFINRCVGEFGRKVMEMILKERNRAAQKLLQGGHRRRKAPRKQETADVSGPHDALK